MNRISLLDCTLRDGGYINNWEFSHEQIVSTIGNLTNAGIDYIEVGYLTSITSDVIGTRFADMESVSAFFPKDRMRSKYVVMADVAQFDTSVLCERSATTADGIRVVFYKRQIEQAFEFCKHIVEKGYDLFLQPMVTVDYTLAEFGELVSRFSKSYPLYAVAIVDSFGCMNEKDIEGFVKVLDGALPLDIKFGFHGHDNMKLSMQNVLAFVKCQNNRHFVIDASVNGIGRGAGNLATEQISNYCNASLNNIYDLTPIIRVMSDVTEPISHNHKWGYSPYFMLTAMYKAHPNFATFLLINHKISVSDFAEYLKMIPYNMLTKCTRPYVEELYTQFVSKRNEVI